MWAAQPDVDGVGIGVINSGDWYTYAPHHVAVYVGGSVPKESSDDTSLIIATMIPLTCVDFIRWNIIYEPSNFGSPGKPILEQEIQFCLIDK